MTRGEIKRTFSLLAALALVLFLAPPVAADPPGVLEGRVVNGTKGGGPVVGLEAVLRPSVPETAPDYRTTTTDDGAFRFEGLLATPSVSYTLSVRYAGVEYKGPVVAFGPGVELKQVEMPVYEATEGSAAIRIDLAHVVLEVDPASRTLAVLEFQSLSNRGDTTYVGPPGTGRGQREVLRFPLPQGAVHMQPIEGLSRETVVPVEGSFSDPNPLLPGKRDIAFFYMLEYSSGSYAFLRPLAYATDRLNLLVSDVGAQVRAPGFSTQQTVDIGGKRYLQLSADGLAPGQSLEVNLVGLPLGQGGARGVAVDLKPAAIGLPPSVLGALLVYWLLRSQRRQTRPAHVVNPAEEKAQLLRSLVDLDDSYEAGRIPEPEYRRLRAEMKRRLTELW